MLHQKKNPVAEPANELEGVVATVAELSAMRKQARRLSLDSKGKVKTLLAGPFRSPFRGSGMEFEEVRVYQPGDDPRMIDWRVSARSSRVYSKLFSEERERPLVFLVDEGATMRFGTRGAFKSVVAARVAALLAWAGFDAGHRVGGIVRSSTGHLELPPRRSKSRVFGFIKSLAEASAQTGPTEGVSFARLIARLWRMSPPGARVFVISDFYDLDHAAHVQLARLARRCDLTCVVVYDQLEESPPPPGTYRVTDGKQTFSFTAGDDKWRAAYAQRLEARRDSVRQLSRKHGIHLVTLRTDQDPEPLLLRALGERAQRGKPSPRNPSNPASTKAR